MMEISFGAIWGGLLALGLWMNRRRIAQDDMHADVVVAPAWEFALAAVYMLLVIGAEFSNNLHLGLFLEFGFVIAFLPVIGILGGRYWPYLFPLPIVALPIAGKTLRELSYESADMARPLGWILLFIIPLVVTTGLARWLMYRGQAGQSSRTFARVGLLATTWLYFGLNLCFFRFPWPWEAWTGRTPSGIIFAVCALAHRRGDLSRSGVRIALFVDRSPVGRISKSVRTRATRREGAVTWTVPGRTWKSIPQA
jgi:hypothetical protein